MRMAVSVPASASDAAERIGDERVAEELDAVRARLVLVADAIRRRDEHAVGDRVRALHRAPRVHLRAAELRFLARMPADRRRIEQDVGAEQRRDARRLGIPLIPADQHADVREARFPDAESARLLRDATDAVDAIVRRRVARREVVLLVEERIVGNVHLAIHAEQRPVRVDDRRGVAIDAARLPLEDRDDENDAKLLGQRLHAVGRRPGDRLGEVEALALLRFAEVRRVEQLLEANDLRPARRGFADAADGASTFFAASSLAASWMMPTVNGACSHAEN